ncbi:F0F1 ATP synthase subunit alpha [Acholeplasma granularum]|uniref:F0F1 ATP synthase subunit alpha n=1 Tax=Acholeplasma granularum TaxID=264635 RepID=UPI00046FB565|nr:F0F1 ATP synthase subunit alpha [Acholeplasma granularum]
MAKIDIDQISALIQKQIEDYKADVRLESVGKVLSVADGIATVYGLSQAILGELVELPHDVKGLVFNLEQYHVGIILFGRTDLIKEGDNVRATKRIFEVPVGNDLLGRVIDPLGQPLDLKGTINADKYYPVERPAKDLMDRGFINEPLQTGIKVIDALVPIGKGQRELIIGDRQTGKSTIAIDTIINQRGKNVICIYVAIGQKDATVANLVKLLQIKDALDYTVVVNASASKEATLLYIAPYTGSSIAEYFMEQGKDVLIIYDDLTKHAVAYRELSLLMKRPSGREAYPGDIFYLHSRLLERAGKLSKELGGGSITALPIVETQAGDISAYIPTNIISITDGQLYLENKLFFQGVRPAINAGLSVSRVGGSAQWKGMKQVAGTLRIALANFRELESFAQFGSDLDPSSKRRLDRGRKTVEILKQDVHELIDLPSQIVTFYALENGFMDDLNLKQIRSLMAEIEQGLSLNEVGKKLKAQLIKDKAITDKKLMEEFIDHVRRFI